MSFCPVCRHPAKNLLPLSAVMTLNCATCGSYSITPAAFADLLYWQKDSRLRLAALVRLASDHDAIVALDESNVVKLAA